MLYKVVIVIFLKVVLKYIYNFKHSMDLKTLCKQYIMETYFEIVGKLNLYVHKQPLFVHKKTLDTLFFLSTALLIGITLQELS